jgi:hypothetical protein
MKPYTVVLHDSGNDYPVEHVTADSPEHAAELAKRAPYSTDEYDDDTIEDLALATRVVAVFEGHHTAIA